MVHIIYSEWIFTLNHVQCIQSSFPTPPTTYHKEKNKIDDFQCTKNNFLSNVCWQDSEKTWLKTPWERYKCILEPHFN